MSSTVHRPYTQSVQAQGVNSFFFLLGNEASTVVVLLGGNQHPMTTEEVQLGCTGVVSRGNMSLGGWGKGNLQIKATVNL